MELSEVRCSSASEEPYPPNKTPTPPSSGSSDGSARPKRLLWQNAVRLITEQRFIHEQGGGEAGGAGGGGGGGVKGGGPDEPYDPSQDARKQSAAGRRASAGGDRHNNGGTKVFPERASSDLGFLQIERAPSSADCFLSRGHTHRGVIFPTLRNAFKSRDLERLYQRYFLGQRRKSVVVMNLLDVVTKLALLLLHLALAAAPMDPLKGALLGFFAGVELVICALVAVRKDTTSHSYLQYSGAVTWVAMATQVLATGLGYGLLGDGAGYVLFALFATYSVLPLPLAWAIAAGLLTSALHLLVQMLVSQHAPLSGRQVGLTWRATRDPASCSPPSHLLSCFTPLLLHSSFTPPLLLHSSFNPLLLHTSHPLLLHSSSPPSHLSSFTPPPSTPPPHTHTPPALLFPLVLITFPRDLPPLSPSSSLFSPSGISSSFPPISTNSSTLLHC